jgi:mannitol-1-phosphate 5-dehydrogenase
MKKLIQFGAGKIGRSFIAQLFSRAGYEVVFIDVFDKVVDALNKQGRYKVVVKENKGDEIIWVEKVRAINPQSDRNLVINEIATADILAVSVGQNGLPHIMPIIAEGLNHRYSRQKDQPIDIIIAENLRNADDYFRKSLKPLMDRDYPFNNLIGLVETSIGKMVPIMTKKDMQEDVLQVFAESYNTLILDKKGFKRPVPDVPGLAPKENMKAWVDRKLFIHNLGHATTAYLGYLNHPETVYIFELLQDKMLKQRVRDTMIQSGNILLAMYPYEFDKQHIIDHVDDLISRFENKALGDTVFRVGCDLKRKLGVEDRLLGAIVKGVQLEMSVNLILDAFVAGLLFRAKDEEENLFPGDSELAVLLEGGVDKVLTDICGLDWNKNKNIIESINKRYHELIRNNS